MRPIEPNRGGEAPVRFVDTDAEWQRELSSKQQDFYGAYGKAIGYSRISSDGHIEWNYEVNSSVGNRYLLGEQREIKSAADLELSVRNFEQMCEPKWLEHLPTRATASQLESIMKVVPGGEDSAKFIRMDGLVDNSIGPAAGNLQWHLGAVNWSLMHQKWALEAVSGVLILYRELLEETRASVVRAIDQGITALNEVADSDTGTFSTVLMDLAVEGGAGFLTGGPSNALKALGAGTVNQSINAFAAGIRKDKLAHGDATKIVGAVKQSIDDIETTLDEGMRTVESALDAIWASLSEPRHPMPSRNDPGRTVGLRIPLPRVAKGEFQQPDDWQFPTG